MLSALQRTHNAAQAILKKVAPHVSPPTRNLDTCQVLTLSPLALPPSRSLTAQLVTKGVTDFIAERVSCALSRVIERLKRTFEEDYLRRLSETQAQFAQDSKLPFLVQSTYLTLYAKTIDEWKTYILSDFVPRLLQAQTLRSQRSSSPDGTTRRRPFNQNAVPVLEQAFSKNPFPSRLDKVELASLCEMDYRQVHVWFQNRRSRCRKEGRELTRRSQSPLQIELERSVDALLNDLDDDDDDSGKTSQMPRCSEASMSMTVSTANPILSFHLETPAHAFPHPYPPQCPYDPFPMGSKASEFQLPWLRIPAAAVNELNSTSPDIASLTVTFSKLTLLDAQSEEISSSSPAPGVSSGQGLGSYLAFVTPCASAPHPALARPCGPESKSLRVSSLASHGVHVARGQRSARSPQRRSQKRSSTPFTMAPPCGLPAPEPHTTKRTLPHRIPKHPPIQRKVQNSPYSTPSHLFSTSSTSTPSSASSGTGTESDIDSPLITPPLLPNLLISSIEQVIPPFVLDRSREWGDLSYFHKEAAWSDENLSLLSDTFFRLAESPTPIAS